MPPSPPDSASTEPSAVSASAQANAGSSGDLGRRERMLLAAVAAVLALATRTGTPVVTRGSGTGLSGGSLPNQQVLPAIDWLMSPAGGSKKKIFLLGSDYVYPRTVNYIVRRQLDSMELRPAGEVYVPLGQRDFTTAVQPASVSSASNTTCLSSCRSLLYASGRPLSTVSSATRSGRLRRPAQPRPTS